MTILGVTASSILKAPQNVYDSISTVTVGAGGSPSVNVASIPSTYTHLQLRFSINRTSATGDFLQIRLNGDTTTTNYATHILYGIGNGSNALASSWDSTAGRAYHLFMVANGYTQPVAGVLDILDYTNTNKNKVTRMLYGSSSNTTSYNEVGLLSGLYLSASAVSSITFSNSSGANIEQHSSFALYGIKTA